MKIYLSAFLFCFLMLTSCNKDDDMKIEEEEEEEMEIDSCLGFHPSRADFEISNSNLINTFCGFLAQTEIGNTVFNKDTFDYPAALVFTSADDSNDSYEWVISPSIGSPTIISANSTNLVLGDKTQNTITYTITLKTEKSDSLECSGSPISTDTKSRIIHVTNPYNSALYTEIEGSWQGESTANPGVPMVISFTANEDLELNYAVSGLVPGANPRVSAVVGARFVSISQSFSENVTTCGIGRLNTEGQLVIDYYEYSTSFDGPIKYRFVGEKL